MPLARIYSALSPRDSGIFLPRLLARVESKMLVLNIKKPGSATNF